MPWTVSGIFMASTLGVSTVAYAPWALFCYGGLFFSILIAGLYRRTGFGIRRLDGEPELLEGSSRTRAPNGGL